MRAVLPALLYIQHNIEALNLVTITERKKLEIIQAKALRNPLDLPRTTAYMVWGF